MSDQPQSTFTVAVVLNRDLLFGSRIRSALASAGLQARFVSDTPRLVAALEELCDSTAIVIVDMNGPVAWDVLTPMLGTSSGLPVIAFGPHVDVDGRRAAKAAGVTRIVSNGQFHSEMAALIERYRRL